MQKLGRGPIWIQQCDFRASSKQSVNLVACDNLQGLMTWWHWQMSQYDSTGWWPRVKATSQRKQHRGQDKEREGFMRTEKCEEPLPNRPKSPSYTNYKEKKERKSLLKSSKAVPNTGGAFTRISFGKPESRGLFKFSPGHPLITCFHEWPQHATQQKCSSWGSSWARRKGFPPRPKSSPQSWDLGKPHPRNAPPPRKL